MHLIFVLLLPLVITAQKGLRYNDHISYQVDTVNGEYIIAFSFMDPFRNMQSLTMAFPVEVTHSMILRFGIPASMFDPYPDSEENRRKRQEIISEGLFKQKGEYLIVDKSAILNYYAPVFCKPIAEWIAGTLQAKGKDSRKNRIEMAMSFVQDIPYGMPDKDDNRFHYGGILTPPEILIRMYGDCDSKALLFAGILSYLTESNDYVFLNQKNHVLTAVKGKPANGQTYIKYQGDTYLLAETAGPGKRKLGEKGDYFRNEFEVETVDFICQPIPPGKNSPQTTGNVSDEEKKVTLRNSSSRQFRFQVSHNRQKWNDFYLDPKHYTGLPVDHKKQLYIRIRNSKGKYEEYSLEPGKEYITSYHSGKKRWELHVISPDS
ncbi:MAG: hypothetical protein JXA03_06445 [Bacteroidales bacterium]|nr:hypothetical protein [Bacteroidales bacterium]